MLLRRLETTIGNCLVEDITEFNRLSQLFTLYQSTGKRLQTANLGFGTREAMFKNEATNDVTPQLFRSEEHFSKAIPANGSKRVVMKLDLCSFLNQHHWIPLWALSGGIDIRLTLADPRSVTVLNTAGGRADQLAELHVGKHFIFRVDEDGRQRAPGDVSQTASRGGVS